MPFFSLRFFYVPLAVVALAGVVFGLGAIFGLGIVGSPAPTPRATGDINFTSKPKVVDKRADVDATNGSALSPVYPAAPSPAPADEKPAAPADHAAAAPDVRSEPPAHRDDSQAAPTAPADVAKTTGTVTTGAKTMDTKTTGTVTREAVASAPASKPAQAAPAEAAPAKAASAQPAPAEAAPAHAKTCDVRGCASAYHSFRESDCTYQPYSGPRRVCEGPPGTHSASTSDQRDLRDDTRRQSRKVEPDDDEGDVQPLSDDDMDDRPRVPSRRMIVIDPDGNW
jgi:hypothetical protein